MAVDGVGQTQTGNTTTSAAASQARLTENFDTFLTLLTAQLKNQDPLNPMDSHEFTNQLVMFSGVEQQIKQNQNLETMIQLQQISEQASTMSYIGRYVSAEGATAPLQNGEANWSYALEEGAISTKLDVLNADGEVVYTTSGEIEGGAHRFKWDGKNISGQQLEDGAYTLRITALDRDSKAVDSAIGYVGRVTGIGKSDLGPVLKFGEMGLLLDKAISVEEDPAANA
ncbi:flagellar hook assembly protein FlgD [Oceanibaculum pacificum]|uniref:Basal-body rod modification protein FlgD n=1 Tax=Oceanibaculum pacificum TaxID=580166 RepID=A0A154WGP5_9PROT|nr:flagellar hook assembly protein FlgD [Oceanibaculum pacificum]KZD12700.1 hypothetical protein AUP43_15420 [Oceanibaculum pacificum]